MALDIATTGETITLDETAGLQNATATPAPAGDANDNDIANAALPTAFSARLTALGLGAPTIGTALSGYTGAAGNTGSNIISVTPAPGGDITDLSLVGPGGAPLNGLDSGLDTLSGANILLYTDTNNNIVLGREEGTNVIVFALYLEETGTPVTGAKMWTVQYQPLLNTDPTNHDDPLNLLDKVFVAASQDQEFSLAGAPSGQNLFLMFTTANPTTQVDINGVTRITDPTIIATGKDPLNQSEGGNITSGDTINSSQASGSTTFGTNNQMIVEGEGIRFSFVTGARQDVTIPNLDQNEADVEANIDFTSMFNASSATFDVVQLQSGRSAVVKVTALSTAAEPGVNFIDGYGNDATVAITRVIVSQGGSVLVDTDDALTGGGVTVAFDINGVATISGVKAGYNIEYTTTGDHNRVLVENAGTGRGNASADFDIGGFQLLQVSTATVEVGSKVNFEDDGPTIAANTELTPTLTTDDTEIVDTAGPVSFAGLFTSAFGTDGFKDVDDNDIQDADAITYTLGVSGANAVSGLTDTLTGDGVVLNKVGNDIVGTAGAAGPEVLRITVDASGNVTLTQSRAVVHDDPLDPSESTSPAALLSADLVTLAATITDGDGDTATATRNIGDAFKFEDDGPTIAANTEPTPTLTTDDTEIVDTAGPVSFAGLFTSDFGKDSFKDVDDNDVQDADAITYTLGVSGSNAVSGLTDTLTGDGVVLNKVGNDIVGTAGAAGPEVLRITVDASGNVTLTQSRAVVHDDPLDPSESTSPAVLLSADLVTLAATITDGDGDTATATRNIGDAFKFEDDGPTIAANTEPTPTLTTDDTEIVDTAGPVSFAGLFTSAFGNDGFKDSDDNDVQDADAITYTLGVSGANAVSGLTDTLTGDGVVLNKVGNDIVGTAGAAGPEVLRITVDASGNVTLTQSRAVVHDDPLDPSESTSPAALLSADLVTLAATITDGDGDTATATRNIGDAFKFEDDGPTLDFGNLVGTGTITPQYGEWNRSVGADQPGNLNISLNQFQLVRPNGTTINGSSFTFNELAGSPDASGNFLFAGSLTADFDNIAATPDTTVDFTLTALNDGSYVFDLLQGFGSTVTLSSADGSLDAGGPDPVRTLTIPPDEQVVFFGVQATTSDSDIVSAIGLGEPDLTEAQVEAGGFAFLGTANMNVSTSGIGIGNNNLDGNTTAGINAGDESFIINPETLLTGMKVFIDNSVGGYDPATEELYYKIFFDDGTNSGNIKVLSGDLNPETGGQVSFDIETQGSKLIDSVQLTMGTGTIKIPVIEFIQATENLASDVLLDFTASLTDADGDSATSDFSIDLFANDLGGTFDFTLAGTSSDQDSFNVDLSALQDSYKIEGFDTPIDQLALLGDLGANVSINNSGTDSIVSVTETGGQTTVITVVGVDLAPADVVVV